GWTRSRSASPRSASFAPGWRAWTPSSRPQGRVSRAEHLAALRKVCKDWRTLLHADPAHGRRVLRDLRIDRVVVRRDEHGRWSYKLVGDLSKLAGLDGHFYAVTDEALASWIDERDDVVEPADPEDQDWCPRQGTSGTTDILRSLAPVSFSGTVARLTATGFAVVATHALARDAAGGVGGVDQGERAMTQFPRSATLVVVLLFLGSVAALLPAQARAQSDTHKRILGPMERND